MLTVEERAVLVALKELGAMPGGRFVRSTRVLGRVLGGPPRSLEGELVSGRWDQAHDADVASYAALVKLAQPFRMRYPLVEGRGNFGSVDGDAPADVPFTEARLGPLALDVLDGRVPHELTNDPLPHHLGELAAAARARSLDDLLAVMPGPDFPTGGWVDGQEVRRLYASGRGALHVSGSVEPRGEELVVTALPFGVRTTPLVLALVGLGEVEDLSDPSGVRIVVRGARRDEVEALLVRRLELDGPPMLERLRGLDSSALATVAAAFAGFRRTRVC